MPEQMSIRSRIADACRRMAADGLVVGTAGNVSVRTGEHIAITATGAAFETMAAQEITLVDPGGAVVSGEFTPTSELDLHLGIYRACDANAIVHTHSPMATAVGLVVDELPCVHYQMLTLGGAVRVAPYATFGTPELADNVRIALDGRSAALMANHGAVTHAADLDKAVASASLLEWACTVYWHAAAIGTPRVLDAAAQADVIAAVVERRYGSPRPVTKEA